MSYDILWKERMTVSDLRVSGYLSLSKTSFGKKNQMIADETWVLKYDPDTTPKSTMGISRILKGGNEGENGMSELYPTNRQISRATGLTR